MPRRLLILTEGFSNPRNAKTASCLLRYRGEEVEAVLDSTQQGQTTQSLLGVGGDTPVVGSLEEAPNANTLLIGIAPPGGKIPPPWRSVILGAIERGMNVVSGLHEFLSEDEEFAVAAAKRGATITDVRKNDEKDVARRIGLREECLRIHTVGNDVSIGKMVTSVEIALGIQRRGHDAKFVATGQTGIMVEGDGLPIDCVTADFISGAAEKLVLQNQHHEILVVEGQGSLVHPSFSGVTLGLLHGCSPHGMILCYEVGRERVAGVESMAIPQLSVVKEMNELMASAVQPSRVIGVAMNSSKVTSKEAETERNRIRDQFGLPVCDVIRHGADELVDAVLALHAERR